VSFPSLCFACSFFSISDLTSFSGAFPTNASFNSFLSRITIYSFVSRICSFILSISLSVSSAFDVSIYTSTQALIIQKARLLSVIFFSINSILSAFTIPQIKCSTLHKISAFLFFA
jgi:hypothetical protein